MMANKTKCMVWVATRHHPDRFHLTAHCATRASAKNSLCTKANHLAARIPASPDNLVVKKSWLYKAKWFRYALLVENVLCTNKEKGTSACSHGLETSR